MIVATLKGRLQTKLLTYLILFPVTVFFAVVYNHNYWTVFVIAVAVGLVLEVLWSFLVPYQSGWMTFAMGAIEFFAIILYVVLLNVPMVFMIASAYYLTAWVLIQLFLIYILPIWRLSWADDGLELW